MNRLVGLWILLSLIACQSGDERSAYYAPGKGDTIQREEEPVQVTELPQHFGFGRKATGKEIAAWDIDIMPDGRGLPAGQGTVQSGRAIYDAKCIACHGKNGVGGSYSRLVGVMGDTVKAKTIGNYWPYASTLYDYIRRTMPYTTPGTLTNEEVYSLTAYLLHLNKIIDSTMIMSAKTLTKVVMPAQHLFINDDRKGGPEVR